MLRNYRFCFFKELRFCDLGVFVIVNLDFHYVASRRLTDCEQHHTPYNRAEKSINFPSFPPPKLSYKHRSQVLQCVSQLDENCECEKGFYAILLGEEVGDEAVGWRA